MATEFETESTFHAVVDTASLRDARKEVERELGDIELSVDAVAQTGGSGGGGRGGRAGGRGSISETNSYLDELDDLAIERNDILRELLEETELGNRTQGRGRLGGGGGLLGLLGLGLGAGALGLSGLTDALKNFDPNLPEIPGEIDVPVPDEIPVDAPDSIGIDAPGELPVDIPALDEIPIDVPENVPLDAPEDLPLDAPENLPLDAPEDLPLDAPENIPLDAPENIPLDAPSSVPLSAPFPIPIPVASAAADAAETTAESGVVESTVMTAGARNAETIAGGVETANDLGLLGGPPQVPEWYQEDVRRGFGEALNAPAPTAHPGVVGGDPDGATMGGAVRRLGSASLVAGTGVGTAGLLSGSVARAGLAASIGLAGASGAAAADSSDDSGNRSTTRRRETSVNIEVDARDSRNTQQVIQEIKRELPQLRRRLDRLERGIERNGR
jgi:hypothetical protein